MRLKRVLAMVMVVALLMVFAVGCGGGGNPKDDKVTDAWIFARHYVKNQLKSPSSAKFPADYKDYVTDLGGNKYKVSAYVDADNSFGASIRTYFTIELKITGELTYDIISADIK